MLREFIIKNKKIVIGSISVCLVLFIGGVSLYAFTGGFHGAGQEQAVGKFDAAIRIVPKTEIQQVYYYALCKDEDDMSSVPSAELIGLEYKDFQQIYSQWNIEAFNEEQVRMSLLVNDYCPWHKKHQFIGEKDGFVAIYCGEPDKRQIATEQTNIALTSLHPQVADEVKNGLVFNGKEEMLRLLEGIQSR